MPPPVPPVPPEVSSDEHVNHIQTCAYLHRHRPIGPVRQRSQSVASAAQMLAVTASAPRSVSPSPGSRARSGYMGVARRTLGIALLLVTVFLWTASNFLASYIFSDNTFSKPFFVVYINTSVFAASLIPLLGKFVAKNGVAALRTRAIELWREQPSAGWGGWRSVDGSAQLKARREDSDEVEEDAALLVGDVDDDDEPGFEGMGMDDSAIHGSNRTDDDGQKLNFHATAWLSLKFCMLWFLANYFASACLEYTSVGSVTILTSTSSIWTLVFCALMRVESFTVRKLLGVLASLAGVILISSIDLSGTDDKNRGSFPHKSAAQISLGDAMAFLSAIVYGLYVTVMKTKVGNEERVNMPLFFGLVGLYNVLLLWPGFFILHFTGIETFALPPDGKVYLIILLNSLSSFVSDMSWAYAMLLTTPLIVTVGLSLTIPLSLIGEMIQYHQYSSWVYWLGAGIVLSSFLFINHESKEVGARANRGHETVV